MTFVLVSGFFKDVLGVVGKLSQVFQRDNVDIETVNIMVESTRMKITQFKTKNGIELAKVYDELTKSKPLYHGVKVTARDCSLMQTTF